ncbi:MULTISPECIES: cation diffusion facilitator family transporter [unclassified Granulicatella]|uniref:cation diffusion facilitator family transporter n=1 Tax=unclassified Granulicatella TaxID=2630493 RepID=UPI0010739837|nr:MULTISPECIES: cation diffusion facilitator family transporter [unclassified Granulicatella]MBF0779881.1 cation transporter [Granulicatella sp. 19428wC4_WM01]TFU96085.1 cation transporter [Granulicatella sp. WM01]
MEDLTQKAEKGTLLSIVVYIILASSKIMIGTLCYSMALVADGWNNFTDILSSIAIFIGMRSSRIPADAEHQYGHWKIESIAGLISAFIMFIIGAQVLFSAVHALLLPNSQEFDSILVWTGLLSSGALALTCLYNYRLARITRSAGLRATAQNNRSDALASLVTGVSLFITKMTQLVWIDSLMAIIVSLIILQTAYSIFKDNAFILSDGFDNASLQDYRQVILAHSEVLDIRALKARHYGANIYVDVTVVMPANLTVKESHSVTEDIERELQQNYHVSFIDIHVEPDE